MRNPRAEVPRRRVVPPKTERNPTATLSLGGGGVKTLGKDFIRELAASAAHPKMAEAVDLFPEAFEKLIKLLVELNEKGFLEMMQTPRVTHASAVGDETVWGEQ